jgi:hypothetical protein
MYPFDSRHIVWVANFDLFLIKSCELFEAFVNYWKL